MKDHIDLASLRVTMLATDGFGKIQLASPSKALTKQGPFTWIFTAVPSLFPWINLLYSAVTT